MSDSTSHKGLSPAMAELSRSFCSLFPYNNVVLQPPRRVATSRVWALPRSLATTGGIIHLFSLPRGTKMFQFPRFASLRKQGYQSFRLVGCPIRISPDQRLFAPTRGLTQLITSFIASMSLGIHHSPFPTFFRYSTVSVFLYGLALRHAVTGGSGGSLILSAVLSILSCRKFAGPCGLLVCGRFFLKNFLSYFTVLLVSICQRSLIGYTLRNA